ncbi:MAG: hypothetical protein IPH82_30065 [Chloroflexi bacterium]|nr:hypothetical protein [Chloroflexota bacterium]
MSPPTVGPSPPTAGANDDGVVVSISGSTFSHNTATAPFPGGGNGGGALYLSGGSAAVVHDSRFDGNAAGNGGAIHLLHSNLWAPAVTFTGNTAQNVAGGGGRRRDLHGWHKGAQRSGTPPGLHIPPEQHQPVGWRDFQLSRGNGGDGDRPEYVRRQRLHQSRAGRRDLPPERSGNRPVDHHAQPVCR